MLGRQRTREPLEDAVVEDERDCGRHCHCRERDEDPPPQLLEMLDERRLFFAWEPARPHQSVVSLFSLGSGRAA